MSRLIHAWMAILSRSKVMKMALSAFRMRTAVVTILIGCSAHTATAQVAPPNDGRTVTPKDAATPEAHKTLFTYRDAALVAGFAALTVAMFPVDRHIAESLQDPDLRANRFLEHSAKGVEVITSPGAFIIGGGLYAVGKLTDKKDLADLGWHGTEAAIPASGVTSFLKGTPGPAPPSLPPHPHPPNSTFTHGFP